MIKLLTKLFIKDHENVTNAAVRRAYGTMCSLYGIFLNLLLEGEPFFHLSLKYEGETLVGYRLEA